MSRALVMGSFDPITRGHMSLVDVALSMADEVYLIVMVNDTKVARFSIADRLAMMKIATSENARIIVDSHSGMCYDYCRANSIDVIVRGYRNAAELAYEREMAQYNMEHCSVATEIVNAEDMMQGISSSNALSSDVAAREMLPSGVYDYIANHNVSRRH